MKRPWWNRPWVVWAACYAFIPYDFLWHLCAFIPAGWRESVEEMRDTAKRINREWEDG